MSKTLLKMVQDILVETDGDNVNSIFDTEESEQYANMIITTYNNMMSNTTWPHTRRLLAVTVRSDSNFPTHVTLNDDVKELISISYNKATASDTRSRFDETNYKDPDDFLRLINRRDDSQSNVLKVIDDSGVPLLILNNKAPEYYTSFDDRSIIFDSFDSGVDSTIQASKIQAQGYIIPPFAMTDDAIPDLPPDAFSALTEEATSRIQMKLRQFQDVKSETEAMRQRRRLSRNAWRTNANRKFPDYGKKR